MVTNAFGNEVFNITNSLKEEFGLYKNPRIVAWTYEFKSKRDFPLSFDVEADSLYIKDPRDEKTFEIETVEYVEANDDDKKFRVFTKKTEENNSRRVIIGKLES